MISNAQVMIAEMRKWEARTRGPAARWRALQEEQFDGSDRRRDNPRRSSLGGLGSAMAVVALCLLVPTDVRGLSLAAFNLTGQDIDGATLVRASEAVRAQLRESRDYAVMSGEELCAAVSRLGLQSLAASVDYNSARAVAHLLRVDRAVIGRLEQSGRGYTVRLVMIDVKANKVAKDAVSSFSRFTDRIVSPEFLSMASERPDPAVAGASFAESRRTPTADAPRTGEERAQAPRRDRRAASAAIDGAGGSEADEPAVDRAALAAERVASRPVIPARHRGPGSPAPKAPENDSKAISGVVGGSLAAAAIVAIAIITSQKDGKHNGPETPSTEVVFQW